MIGATEYSGELNSTGENLLILRRVIVALFVSDVHIKRSIMIWLQLCK